MDDLFKRPLHPARQALIQKEYGYPLTNADTYFDWTQLGGTGPSPDQWCRRYADAKVNYPAAFGR